MADGKVLVAQRDRVLAVWEAGFLSDDQVADWADRVLLSQRDASRIPSWLLDLVERGPRACRELGGFGWPEPLDYCSQFCLRAVALDLARDDAVVAFVVWAAVACIGEDLEEPVVQLGYLLDHLVDDRQRMDLAVAQVREDLPALLGACRAQAKELLSLSV